jgi:uncharacterized protein (TIGR02145 family)
MRNKHSSHPENPKIGVIRVQTILAAILGFAFSLTLSCGDHILDDWLGLSSSSSEISSSSILSSSSVISYSSFIEVGNADLLQNATYRTGEFPVGTTGRFDVQMSNTIISGGSTILAVSSDRSLSKLYIQFAGSPGYYEMNISGRDLVSSAGGNYVYNMLLQFTQKLLEQSLQTAGLTQISFSGAAGSAVSPSVSKSVEAIKVGAGALQVSLSWNTVVDLDLHITTPSGSTIYYGNKKVGNGELDLDANVGCPGSRDKRNENTFFTEPLADGNYIVEVNMYTNCIDTATNYAVTAYINGEIFEFSPNQSGEFAGSVKVKKTIGVIRIKNGAVVPAEVVYGTPVAYEGEVYNTVAIGEQVWMARNLNYDAPGSVCYNDSIANCDKYGRLYDFATANTVCPSGWHLPSDAEWGALMKFINPSCYLTGNCSNAGIFLKATSGWNSGGNGADVYGFAALPGGYGSSSNSFSYIGSHGDWWSASEYYSSAAYNRLISYDFDYVRQDSNNKSYLLSVRCVRD